MLTKHLPGAVVIANLFPGDSGGNQAFAWGSGSSQSFPCWAMVVVNLFPVGQWW